jgi:hypothetical protein
VHISEKIEAAFEISGEWAFSFFEKMLTSLDLDPSVYRKRL